MLNYIITAIVIIVAMVFLVKAMWKTSKILVIPIQIILFGVLCFACFKIFFSKENVKQLNNAIENSGISEMNQALLEKGGDAIAKTVNGESSAPAENAPVNTPVAEDAEKVAAKVQQTETLPDEEEEDLPGTKVFRTRNPKDPTFVKVIPVDNKLRIICVFPGKTAFAPDKNAKINAAKADSLCRRGISRFIKLSAGMELEISGLSLVTRTRTGNLEKWIFEVPRNGIKAAEAQEVEEGEEGEEDTPAPAKVTPAPAKKVTPVPAEEPRKKEKAADNDFFKMDTDKIFN